jgi:hypothetical protein
MIPYRSFLSNLSRPECNSKETDRLETWAGLLVLRLYQFWHLDSAIGTAASPLAIAVRSFVNELPGSGRSRYCFLRVLDTLELGGVEQSLTAARHLRDYANDLRRCGQWALAEEVRRMVAICRRVPKVRRRGSPR